MLDRWLGFLRCRLGFRRDRCFVLRCHGGLEAADAFAQAFAQLGKFFGTEDERGDDYCLRKVGRRLWLVVKGTKSEFDFPEVPESS